MNRERPRAETTQTQALPKRSRHGIIAKSDRTIKTRADMGHSNNTRRHRENNRMTEGRKQDECLPVRERGVALIVHPLFEGKQTAREHTITKPVHATRSKWTRHKSAGFRVTRMDIRHSEEHLYVDLTVDIYKSTTIPTWSCHIDVIVCIQQSPLLHNCIEK